MPGTGPGPATGPGARPVSDTGAEDRGPLYAAFGGLTTRGRSFVAAGLAAGLCAYLLGQPDLLHIGALLCLLPLLCVLVVHGTRSQVTADRGLSPTQLPAGSEARVRLSLENRVRGVPTGALLLQDSVPAALGPRPRFVVDRIEPGGRREVSYRVRSELRGRYSLGPLQLRLTDPFGLVELTRSFTAEDVLTVLPAVEPLPAVALGGDAAGGHADGGRSSPSATGEDDVIPRDYRDGDDLRRVHWRSTARRGVLMVRREEEPHTEQCTVLLDTRQAAWAGPGTGTAFERAVSGAASAVAHLTARGYAVRLVTDTGAVLPASDIDRPVASAAGQLIADGLADLQQSPDIGFVGAEEAFAGREPGLLIGFLGSVDPSRGAELHRLRRRAGAAVAFLPTVPGAGPSGEPEAGAQLQAVYGAGWTPLLWGPGVPLAQLWERAAAHVGQPLCVGGGN